MAILKLIGGAAVSILLGLAKDELKAWIPRLTSREIAHAVGHLPFALRARYQEEWHSDILETPGEIGKLIRGFGLVKAAYRIARADRGELRSISEVCLSQCVAAVLLFFCAPLICGLMLIVISRSYGPIFLKIPYRDWDGRRFCWWRYRSFIMLKINGEDYVANTPLLLKIARKFSGILLLLNVAKGEMTLSAAMGYMLFKVQFGAFEPSAVQGSEPVFQ